MSIIEKEIATLQDMLQGLETASNLLDSRDLVGDFKKNVDGMNNDISIFEADIAEEISTLEDSTLCNGCNAITENNDLEDGYCYKCEPEEKP